MRLSGKGLHPNTTTWSSAVSLLLKRVREDTESRQSHPCVHFRAMRYAGRLQANMSNLQEVSALKLHLPTHSSSRCSLHAYRQSCVLYAGSTRSAVTQMATCCISRLWMVLYGTVAASRMTKRSCRFDISAGTLRGERKIWTGATGILTSLTRGEGSCDRS